MHKFISLTIAIILMLSLVLTGQSGDVSARALGATSPTLGAVGSYSVLGGETVTNTGLTTMPGNLGVSPGSAVTGFTGAPDGTVGPPGVIHAADSKAAAAQLANVAAFLALSAGDNAACTTDYGAVTKDLGGLTLGPGVYCANAFQLTGALYLDASSDPNGVWIFRTVLSTLTTATDSSVQWLEGGVGSPCNVWWKVASSADIFTGTSFIGNILALTSINLQTNATLDGRALAQTGEVTLHSNTLAGAECLTTDTTPKKNKVGGLPNSGGAPIRNQDLPWSMLIIGGISALALVFGVRQYRIAKRSK